MTAKIKTELDKYIKCISQVDGIAQIYLFGSYAHGEPQEHSDLDLFVVVDNNQDPLKVTYKINLHLIGKRTMPLDIIVNRIEDFTNAAKENTIQKLVSSNGVLLYEAI